MDLSTILKAIVSGKPRTSAQLREDLQKIDVAALEARVEGLEAERRRLLVHGTDAEVVTISQDITAANLNCERADALIKELERLIAAAEQREAEAAVESTVAEADQVGKKLAADSTELDKAVGKVVSLLGGIADQTAHLRGLNRKIEKAGRPVGKVTDIALVRRRVMERIK